MNWGHDNAIILPRRSGVKDPIACFFDVTFWYLGVMAADDRLRPLLLRNLSRGMRMRCLYAGMGTDLISGLLIEQAAHELWLLDADKPFVQCLEVMISCFAFCLLFYIQTCWCSVLISKTNGGH